MAVTCPACGSENVKVEKVQGSLPIPYGQPATFVETVHTCNDCGTSADFTGENESIVKNALEESAAASAAAMLEDLNKEGITQAHFERALRLPARTAARWKDGAVSAAPLALLRLVRTFPWLLDVSDANFEPTTAARAVLREAANLFFLGVPRESVTNAAWVYVRTETQTVVAAAMEFDPQTAVSISPPTESASVEIHSLFNAIPATGG
ncbi:MAG: hypothetical protein A2289_18390 [Deltaproteobacteria bacterium RIFOXYA12_FULL_58_15]|nr:MAG: hypothetical protein A2289_18390 [Deltaproteobacteria bacterium RIFOXYA12_FULL_58_15]